MSNDTTITLQGWIGSEPTLREVGGASVSSFRIGMTPRRYHRQRDEWVDGETQWYTVNAWRSLADHCHRSLHKGDPVVVHGRLNHRTYLNKSEVEVISLEIDASTIGHDLTRGCSQFLKAPPRERGVGQGAGAAGSPEQGDRFDQVEPAGRTDGDGREDAA